jgi:acyl-CoA thioesterase
VTNKVTNIYEKIINKHPLTLTKNLTFLTFLTKSNCITMLKKAMEQSSINVSLTFLRGLEMTELKEEDMPMV